MLSSCWLLRLLLLLPPPCSFWMTLSISAISRERRKPANQDRNKSAPTSIQRKLQTLHAGFYNASSTRVQAYVGQDMLIYHTCIACKMQPAV